MRILAPLAALFFALPAEAEIDPMSLGKDHFIGHWAFDGLENCGDGDTLSIYASGAWAVTNGGDNPVEALGSWSMTDAGIEVRESELDDPASARAANLVVDAAAAERMEITLAYTDGRSRSYTVERCP
jgi:hypothetical protein